MLHHHGSTDGIAKLEHGPADRLVQVEMGLVHEVHDERAVRGVGERVAGADLLEPAAPLGEDAAARDQLVVAQRQLGMAGAARGDAGQHLVEIAKIGAALSVSNPKPAMIAGRSVVMAFLPSLSFALQAFSVDASGRGGHRVRRRALPDPGDNKAATRSRSPDPATGCTIRVYGMKALLADADFRRVWLVGSIAGGLRWLELLAVGVYVLEQTGSAWMVALMTVVRLAPMFLCGILIGAIADRYERRSLLLLGLVVLTLTSVGAGRARSHRADHALADRDRRLPERHLFRRRLSGSPHHERRDRGRRSARPGDGPGVRDQQRDPHARAGARRPPARDARPAGRLPPGRAALLDQRRPDAAGALSLGQVRGPGPQHPEHAWRGLAVRAGAPHHRRHADGHGGRQLLGLCLHHHGAGDRRAGAWACRRFRSAC